MIVATSAYEEQSTRLTFEDFKQSLLVMLALNGLFFYNSGPKSGFSQKHKHVQVLPSDAMRLSIITLILKDIQ
jgi:ATP adenylyltransferase